MPRAAYGGAGSSGAGSSGGSYVNDWWNQSSGSSSSGLPKLPPIGSTTTGRFTIDVATPGGFTKSLERNQQQADDFVAGIGEALFGQKTGLVNSIPGIGSGIGDIVRGISSIPGAGIPAAVPGHILGAATNVLSRIPLGWLGSDQTFDALPDTPEKRLVEQAANGDILGGGNLKYDYAVKTLKEQQDASTETGFRSLLAPELQTGVAGSAGGLLGQVLQLMGLPGLATRRTIAGLDVRPGGQNRLDEVLALGASNPSALTPTEARVVEMVGRGQWSEDRALDYLTANASGLAKDPAVELIGSVVADPTVIASLASGLISRAAKGAKLVQETLPIGERVGGFGGAALAAQQSSLGPLFKATRSVIDPLSALGGRKNISPEVVDALTVQSRSSAFGLAYGEGSLVAMRNTLAPHGIVDKVFADASGAYDNIAREHAGSQIGDSVLAAGPGALPPAALDQQLPAALVEQRARAMTKPAFGDLVTRLTKVREYVVDEAGLAARMARVYGHDAAYWTPILAKLDDNSRSFLHLATYNVAENGLMQAVAKSVQAAKGLPLARVVVGNPAHLDETAAAQLIKELKAAVKLGKSDAATALSNAITRYENIAGVIRYNPNDVLGSVERAINRLDELVSQQDLPRRAGKDELKAYPELEAWQRSHPEWTIVFRPPDERLWRQVMDTEGQLKYVNPWVGHAPNDGKSLYRPGFELPRNLAGMPVVSNVAKALQGPLDWLEVGQRALRQQVSGSNIAANAERRFYSHVAKKYEMTDPEARQIWRTVRERAQMDEWSKSVRALSANNIWEAITTTDPTRSLIPLRLQGKITARDMSLAVLDAFEGDLRFVGLTQVFTGRMKRMLAQGRLAEFAGGNFAGQVSEKLYPALRFMFHPLFQAQEAVESVILNAQRGVKPFLWGEMSAKDKQIARVAQNLVDKKMIGWFDAPDQAEFASEMLAGGRLQQVVAGLPNGMASLTDESGLKFIARQKRINYLRLWQSEIGPQVRQALGEERFLEFKRTWKIADDDDVALRYLSEQMAESMDVTLTKNGLLDYKANIANAQMWTPTNIGSFAPLNLDYYARSLNFKDVAALREAVSDGRKSLASVIDEMRTFGASDEYLNRAHLALSFDVNDFWRNVRDAYNLTDDEFRAIRGTFDASARIRGLTPVEYLSGVVAPQIKKVAAADLAKSQEIRNTVGLLRTTKGADASTLYTELAAAFRPHLDPSGVDVLRKASGIKGRWGVAHDKWLGEQMRAYVDGVPVANPDVERALAFMGRWTNEAGGMLGVGSPEFQAIMKKTSTMNTAAGVPYNYTEHMVFSSVMERIKSLEQDAYRTHYFKRTRNVLERSVNHPFFGLYPASYMWGKILPEMIRFIAQQPFGLRTGALAYAANDVYNSIAMQRELDPKFDKMMEGLGHSPTAMMLGYMLPAVPWDVPAVLPQWAREIANQGFANKQRRERGMLTKNIDPVAALSRVGDYLNPISGDIDKFSGMAKEIGDTVLGTPAQQAQRGGPQVTIPVLGTKIGGGGQPTPIESLTPVIEDNVKRLTDWLGGTKFE